MSESVIAAGHLLATAAICGSPVYGYHHESFVRRNLFGRSQEIRKEVIAGRR
jgi:hypothetical protein